MSQPDSIPLHHCPRCKDTALASTPAANGIIVDVCPRCHGIFLDYGEVNYFVRPGEIDPYYQTGLIEPHQSQLRCPNDGQMMWEGGLLHKDLQVDECSHCRGLWFGNKELAKLQDLAKSLTKIEPQVTQTYHPEAAAAASNKVGVYAKLAALPGLPNLFVRSVGLLGLLYALMFAFVVVLTTAGGVSPIIAVFGACALIFVQYLISPFIMDYTLRWFNSLRWVSYEELPPHLKDFMLRVCAENKMKAPRVGIIQDYSPNAFTYGHTPQNARVVITQGLIKILEPEELESVVAHELGHA
ncbi:MAG: zf-TFIIB domain-containing protein, partial [Candidatus Alcyoniella australis]|nr:zf-TFIIB domain-containing protein [Candidatus Alcyoniella australis]